MSFIVAHAVLHIQSAQSEKSDLRSDDRRGTSGTPVDCNRGNRLLSQAYDEMGTKP